MNVLVTGAAGFIGSATCRRLAQKGYGVMGIDSFSPYYSPELKSMRVKKFLLQNHIDFLAMDISDKISVEAVFREHDFDAVIHLAAQAGVRTPNERLTEYVEANLVGFANILENIVRFEIPKFIFASSSSIYGDTSHAPYSETEYRLDPTSFYGATKLSNEIMAKAVLSQTDTVSMGLRFFTVYGPWGRPDMAYFRIISNILTGSPFRLFGDGSVKRDFTFIDDAVSGIHALLENSGKLNKGTFEIFNIGGGRPFSINDLIHSIEQLTEKRFEVLHDKPIAADMKETIADSEKLFALTGFIPNTELKVGLTSAIEWADQFEIRDKLRGWVTSTP